MKKDVYTMKEQDAVDCGFVSITRHYTKEEEWMLDRAVANLHNNDIEFVLVPVKHSKTEGQEIWRLEDEVNLQCYEDGFVEPKI